MVVGFAGFGTEDSASPIASSSSALSGIEGSATRGPFREILRRFFLIVERDVDDSGWEGWVTTMAAILTVSIEY
jgi:hypothetical protein